MFLSFIVYFLLLIILCAGGVNYKHNPSKNYASGIIMPVLLFSLIIGLRYGVGTDFFAYRDIYNTLQSDQYIEPGFMFICKALRFLGLPSAFLFILIAFLQLYFFCSFTKRYPSLQPWCMFFYFTTLYLFFSINGIRQALAFSLLVLSVYYIFERKLIKYLLVIIVASSIHRTVLLFLPFYFFIHLDILKNRWILLGVYFTSILIGVTFAERLWLLFDLVVQYIGIEGYNPVVLMNVDWSNEQGRGLGTLFWLLSDAFVILKLNNLKDYYKGYPIVIIFNLFFIGVVLEPVLGSSYLSRVNVYFVNFRILMYSFLFNWALSRKAVSIRKLYSIALIIGFILFMCNAILVGAGECSPYRFVGF